MVLSTLFSDFCRRNRLAILVLLPVFVVTAAILFLGMPVLEHYPAFRYSTGFADGYGILAENLADGSGYRWRADMAETMLREPGYPLLLAAAFKVAGYRIETARLLNLLLAVGAAAMLMALARRMASDQRTPVVAALLFLLHPGTLIAEARGGVEILFIAVGLGFMLALHYAVERGDLWRYLLAGLALGVVVQVRSTPILFPGFLLLYATFTAAGARQRLAAACRVAVLVIGMGLVMVPWVVRNYRLVHEFVPVATLGGVGLQEGLYMCRNVSFGDDLYPVGQAAGRIRGQLAHDLGMRFEGAEYFQTFYNASDETAFNRILYKRARNEYVSDPSLLAGCVGKNLFNLWFLGKTWKVTLLNMIVQIPLLALVFCGLRIVWRRRELRKMGILLAYVGSIVIVHLIVVAEARYSIPVLAFLSIPAAFAVTAIGARFGGTSGAYDNATFRHD
jgi:4-amino-4-deoxy-L-arabinose transferase-like glycosyltransferase